MTGISWHPSPNFSKRSLPIRKVVLHNTAGPAAGSISWLTNPASKVSAHYVVSRLGLVTQLVREEDAAWHAGDRTTNHESIGIEIEAFATATGMTPAQDAAVASLVHWVCDRHSIPAERILLHRQVVKTECPGFVWPRDADFKAWMAAWNVSKV